MVYGTYLQDSWIQIIQVDIEGAKEIITRLQSGFISLGKTQQDQAVNIYAVSGKIAGGYYVSVIPPASFQN